MPRGANVARLALLLVLLCASTSQAAPKWSRLQTEHFLFVGDASAGALRRTAQKLEEFRTVLSAVLSEHAVRSSVPTIVVVFANDASLTPYKPQFRGRAVEVAGYFSAASDVNYIVINDEYEDAGLAAIFHEYSHFLIHNSVATVPAWFDEGLAEVYRTFEERDGGKAAVLGAVPPEHLELLHSVTPIPLTQLLAVEHDSPVYNEGSRRGVFYAESWALVHYLAIGNPSRAAQLRTYLASMQAGVPSDTAFRDAFGDLPTLERELRDYIRMFLFHAVRYQFDASIAKTIPASAGPLGQDDAEAYLADLLSRNGHVDDARTRLRAVIDRNGSAAHALFTLGEIEARASRPADAIPLLERASTLLPEEASVQIAFARALLTTFPESGAERSARLERVRTALAHTVDVNPDAADAAAMLGFAELADRHDLARGAMLLKRAVTLAPANEQYQLMLAQALLQQGNAAAATKYIGPLVARGSTSQVREQARGLLGIAGDAQARRENAAGSASPATTLRLPAAPPPPGGDTPRLTGAASGTVTLASGLRLVLRPVQADETRVQALLTGVDCRPGAITLRLTVAGKEVRLGAARFADVDLISYRQDTTSLGCGTSKNPPRVLATFKAADAHANDNGRAVALELLPDDFPEQ